MLRQQVLASSRSSGRRYYTTVLFCKQGARLAISRTLRCFRGGTAIVTAGQVQIEWAVESLPSTRTVRKVIRNQAGFLLQL